IDSSGSVIPLFKKQIKEGGPLTVTHPDIVRYFMMIPEAVELVIQAGAMAEGGEVFVLDMGEPVKISFLAEQMIRLSGLTLNKDISISYIGLRPGEKMYEELFYGTENKEKTSHEKIFIAKYPDINSSVLCNKIEILINNNENTDFKVLESLIQDIVPYSNSKNNVIPIKDSQSL
ncbi:MAG: polysaccharide biosynthesis protein, partial [Gammaproteobacteria bacterium]